MWEEAAVGSDLVLSPSLFVPPQRAQNCAFGTAAAEEEGQPDVKAVQQEVTALMRRNAALETLVLFSLRMCLREHARWSWADTHTHTPPRWQHWRATRGRRRENGMR